MFFVSVLGFRGSENESSEKKVLEYYEVFEW